MPPSMMLFHQEDIASRYHARALNVVLTVAVCLTSITLASPAPSVVSGVEMGARQAPQCYDYVLISTRGTFEPQGASLGFTNTIAWTLGNLSAQNVHGVEYDTVYPADLSVAAALETGSADICREINAGLLTCPDQKYALLGYSQGAAVVDRALANITANNTAGVEDAVKAVYTIGNVAQVAGQSSTIDDKGGSSTRDGTGAILSSFPYLALSQHWVDSGKVQNLCYTNDGACFGVTIQTLFSFGAHLAYISDQGVQALGARWLIDHLGSAPA